MTIKSKVTYTTSFLAVSIAIIIYLSISAVNDLNYSAHSLGKIMHKIETNGKILKGHEAYVGKLSRALNDNVKFKGQLDPHKCKFGKWYYKFIKSDDYKNNIPTKLKEKFSKMEVAHTKLHGIAKYYNENYIHFDRDLKAIILQKEVDHLNWSRKLSSSISKKYVAKLQTNPKKCKFGRWYSLYIQSDKFNNLDSKMQNLIKSMEEPHKKLHLSAINIIKLQKQGKYSEAMKFYRTTTMSYLKDIKAKMTKAVTTIESYEKHNNPIEYKVLHESVDKLNIVSDTLSSYQKIMDLKEKAIEEHTDEKVTEIDIEIAIGSILIIIALVSMVIINRNILKSIKTLDDGIINLSTSNDTSSRVAVTSNDEIGDITKNFNTYLQTIEDGINEDNKLINDAKSTMDRVVKGWYSETIQGTTSNQSLNAFKDSVNEMINATKQHFLDINKVLTQYAHYDYRNELVIDNIEKGGVFELLVADINKLKTAITTMLVENKSNGLTLQSSSDVLLDNVSSLSSASNQAAASLEETAAALEEITSNITNNTENVVKMASHGNEVKSSVTNGQNLATQTTTAMDEINTEVTAISDAISVIDQIAFQTNILSLNAAVEAATAGEAGKGFAVVAQEVRNLASRSAEAANEIKTLVENAKNKANSGKNIADEMIDGYTHLNESITKTLDLISDVESASKEQLHGIEQINNAVTELDQQTQQNASVANATKDVAVQTQSIAKDIVVDADEKEFIGKETVKTKKNLTNQVLQQAIPVPQEAQRVSTKKVTPQKQIIASSDVDEWESF